MFKTIFCSGIASATDVFNVYYAERCIWHILFKIKGTPGHGSLLMKDTVGEKLRFLIDKIFDFRETQVKRLEENADLTIGDVTTVNITMINGGVQSNVVPPEIQMMTDIRLALDVDQDKFEGMFRNWCNEAGNIDWEWDLKDPYIKPTSIDETNIYWKAFKSTVDDM